MKHPYLTAPLLALLGAGAACDPRIGNLDGGDDIRQLGGFLGVNNRTDARLELVAPGNGLEAGEIMVVCMSEPVDDVEANVDDDGTLLVELAPEAVTVGSCVVRVVTAGLVDLTSEGDGDIDCGRLQAFRRIEVNGNGSIHVVRLEAGLLDLHVRGSGALVVDTVEVETLRIDVPGTGDLTLGGSAVDAQLSLSGAGDLHALGLTVRATLDATLSGSGGARITVLGTVNAEVIGTGTIEIHGGAAEGVVSDTGDGQVIFL